MVEKRDRKGTLFVFGDFDDIPLFELEQVFEFAQERNFVKVVLYPHHENTLRRMGIDVENPYYQRVERLKELTGESTHPIPAVIEEWEGKRKKYTPIETSLAFLRSKYPGPYFLYLEPPYALKVSAYASFEEWIRDVKIFIHGPEDFMATRNLEKFKHRWEMIRTK